MESWVKRYVIFTSFLEIVLATIGFFLLPQMTSMVFIVPILFAVAGIIGITFLKKPKYEKIIRFSSAFMLVNMLKLFACLIFFVVVYINLQQEQKVVFVVTFMALYFAFAILDTIELLKIYKKQ